MAEINDTDFTADAYTEYNNGEEYELPETIIYILLLNYAVSSGISLIGNATIIIQNAVIKKVKSPSNCYMTSMAFSGILLVVFCVPFTMLTNFVNYTWGSGHFMCSVLSYGQTACAIQYSFTLMASSVDRHRALCRPLRRKQSPRMVLGIIGGILIASFVIAVPTAYYSTIVPNNHTELCVEVWPGNTYRQLYSSVLMTLTYGIPLLVLMVTYGHITRILGQKPPGEECQQMLARRFSARKKNIKVFLLVFTSYCICWLPTHVITIAGDVKPSIYEDKWMHVLWLFAQWMAVSNSAITAITTYFSRSKLPLCLSKEHFVRAERNASLAAWTHPIRRTTQETVL